MVKRFAVMATVLAAASCGEFRTRWLYEPDCTQVLEVELKDVKRFGWVNEPLVLELTGTPAPLEWSVVGGRLPAGLVLGAETGVISGFPEEAGRFEVVVEASAPSWSPDHECVQEASCHVTLELERQCGTSADCAAMAPGTDWTGQCEDDGLCHFSDNMECPAAFGAGCTWKGPAKLFNSAISGWKVVGHREMSSKERKLAQVESLTHVLEAQAGENKASLYYRLPGEWPAPCREGDMLSISGVLPGETPASAFSLFLSSGEPLLLVHEGPFQPEVLDRACGADGCDLELRQLHLAGCPGEENQCGTGRPDMLALETLAGASALAWTGQSRELAWKGKDVLFSVASAYSYAKSTWNVQQCSGLSPKWASFILYRMDSCPIARISRAKAEGKTIDLSAATDAIPSVSVTGWSSFGPDGTKVTEWEWGPLDQPYPELVKLFPKYGSAGGNGEPQFWSLPLTAAGTYLVRLTVTDHGGRASCIPDVEEVEVRASPDIDLRLELVWQTMEGSFLHDEEFDLMVQYPEYSSSWDDPDWVCCQSNPKPLAWQKGDEARKDEVCDFAAGAIAAGLPEVITVTRLSADHIKSLYKVGVRASPANSRSCRATLRVFLQGQLMYVQQDRVVAPGETWYAGDVDTQAMRFVGNGK